MTKFSNILFRVKRKTFFIFSRLVHRSVIVYWDGGICSQINMYAVGLFFAKKNIRALHDLSWYDVAGTDCNGNKNRPFLFDQAFPSIKIKKASAKKVAFYKEFFVSNEGDFTALKAPLYLPLYYDALPIIAQNKQFFCKNFAPAIDANSKSAKILQKITSNKNACGVHVRRGDLASFVSTYGEPASLDYFLCATKKVLAKNNNAHFYFFSDDLDYVRQELIPYLKEKLQGNANFCYTIVDCNDTLQGHIDLFLLSRCANIISSHGSFGIFATLLSPFSAGLHIFSANMPEQKKMRIAELIPKAIFL